MAVIRPFKALRPHPDAASLVASVPYDVVNTEEAKALARGNALSLLHVTRSEISFGETVNPYSMEVYKKAKENLDKIKQNAPLIVEEKASFYLYRLIMDGRAQTGIGTVFSVDDYENNVILKHEKTRKEKEDDRTNHIVTTAAQTGPVLMTYRGVLPINEIVSNVIHTEKPLYDFTSADGIQHTVWVLPEGYNQTVIGEMVRVKNIYIADGHHRAASAWRAREAKKNQNKNHTGEEEYNFFIGVLFPAEQLKIMPYNRVVADLNGKSKNELLSEINEKFSIEAVDEASPKGKNIFGMFLENQWYKLTPRDAVMASNSLSKSISDTLDVSILQNFLLNPIFNIDDPRTNKRIDFVGGIRGTEELEQLVKSGKAAAAFSLYPISVEDLIRISDAGEIMPPKSTWFEPKLRDGLLIHTI